MSSTGQPGRRAVRIGTITVGEGPAVVVEGPAGAGQGADARWLSLRDRTHDGAVAEARAAWQGPLLVEPGSAGDLPAVAEHADAVVVGAGWTGDPSLLRAAARLGLPVVVQRCPGDSLDAWLDAAGHCAAEGGGDVVLCEGGGPAHPVADLALLRAAGRRTGRPVLAALGEDAGLAAAEVSAG
ncbi:3-deoxy-D-arabinoheptulosonate-7-phosphate synthase, partial [Sphaerisporangium corydalis]